MRVTHNVAVRVHKGRTRFTLLRAHRALVSLAGAGVVRAVQRVVHPERDVVTRCLGQGRRPAESAVYAICMPLLAHHSHKGAAHERFFCNER